MKLHKHEFVNKKPSKAKAKETQIQQGIFARTSETP